MSGRLSEVRQIPTYSPGITTSRQTMTRRCLVSSHSRKIAHVGQIMKCLLSVTHIRHTLCMQHCGILKPTTHLLWPNIVAAILELTSTDRFTIGMKDLSVSMLAQILTHRATSILFVFKRSLQLKHGPARLQSGISIIS